MSRLVIVGGGRMGEALLGGLARSGWVPADLAVVEPLASRRASLAESFAGVDVWAEVPASLAGHDALLAVKPADVEAACASLSSASARRVLSIAAGVSTTSLQRWLGPGVAVLRAMPNTPALVGQGVSALTAGSSASEDDLRWGVSVLVSVGAVHVVGESLMDAVTGLTGSGPAYVFLVAEALIDAGVLVGLPRDTSVAMVVQLLVGSAAMLSQEGEPERLRAQVTSPGGTTAAGLRELERAGIRSALLDAVSAATARSRELGA